MKYIDIGISWFYGFITDKFDIYTNHDKWLHLTLMVLWMFIFSPLIGFEWAFISAQAVVVGREVYGVGKLYIKEGYDLLPAYTNGFSWKDIVAGELGIFIGLWLSLFFTMIVLLIK